MALFLGSIQSGGQSSHRKISIGNGYRDINETGRVSDKTIEAGKYERARGRRRTLLSAGPLDLLGEADTDEAVTRLELLHGLGRVVDEGETGGLAATELGAETKDGDLLLGRLVHGAELLPELLLGDVGAARVEDVTAKGEKTLWLAHGPLFSPSIACPK